MEGNNRERENVVRKDEWKEEKRKKRRKERKNGNREREREEKRGYFCRTEKLLLDPFRLLPFGERSAGAFLAQRHIQFFLFSLSMFCFVLFVRFPTRLFFMQGGRNKNRARRSNLRDNTTRLPRSSYLSLLPSLETGRQTFLFWWCAFQVLFFLLSLGMS